MWQKFITLICFVNSKHKMLCYEYKTSKIHFHLSGRRVNTKRFMNMYKHETLLLKNLNYFYVVTYQN